MARLQSLKQERFVESSASPTTSTQVLGGSSGVPRMHPMKSSNPVFKATSLIHKLRVPSMPHLSGVRLPKL